VFGESPETESSEWVGREKGEGSWLWSCYSGLVLWVWCEACRFLGFCGSGCEFRVGGFFFYVIFWELGRDCGGGEWRVLVVGGFGVCESVEREDGEDNNEDADDEEGAEEDGAHCADDAAARVPLPS
jgi:hypothetical protein